MRHLKITPVKVNLDLKGDFRLTGYCFLKFLSSEIWPLFHHLEFTAFYTVTKMKWDYLRRGISPEFLMRIKNLELLKLVF